jgi:hypothetical protein
MNRFAQLPATQGVGTLQLQRTRVPANGLGFVASRATSRARAPADGSRGKRILERWPHDRASPDLIRTTSDNQLGNRVIRSVVANSGTPLDHGHQPASRQP